MDNASERPLGKNTRCAQWPRTAVIPMVNTYPSRRVASGMQVLAMFNRDFSPLTQASE